MGRPRLLARLERAEGRLHRLDWVRAWKKRHPGRRALGILPGTVPIELVHASGDLPVLVVGGEPVEGGGGPWAQSYMCPWPHRLGAGRAGGNLDVLDGLLAGGPCDVLRNLTGAWSLERSGSWARYVDRPLACRAGTRRAFARERVRRLAADLGLGSRPGSPERRLRRSIRLYNRLRAGLAELYRRRARDPERWPGTDVYRVARAAGAFPPEAYVDFLEEFLREGARTAGVRGDPARIFVAGLFCEAPPAAFFETLERAGCAVVGDDVAFGPSGWGRKVPESGDPFEALAAAYGAIEGPPAWVPDEDGRRAERFIRRLARLGVDGVLLAAPCFCDPALLEEPALVSALEAAGLPWMSVRFAGGGGSLRVLEEQAEAFADAVRLRGLGV
ncbi:MAG: 2-hydroxyacyl-CoA dehydratase subunit D [Planctomycetota bacterium]